MYTYLTGSHDPCMDGLMLQRQPKSAMQCYDVVVLHNHHPWITVSITGPYALL